VEPDRCCRQRDENNTEHFGELEGVLMIVAFEVLMWRVVRRQLVLVDVHRSFAGGGHKIS
jgi:hypothetical protein